MVESPTEKKCVIKYRNSVKLIHIINALLVAFQNVILFSHIEHHFLRISFVEWEMTK